MSELRAFFEERKGEVNTYFTFINYVGIDHVGHKNIKFDSQHNLLTTNELKQVLKSNCILILYNLIEGVVTKSMEYIVDDINDKNISYKDLQLGFKQLILQTTNNINPNDFKDKNINLVNFIDVVFDEIFSFTFNKKNKKFVLGGGGNIDARMIREDISKKFNIKFSRKEDTLLDIKKDRNDLAHGSKSYIECSQGKTLKDIKKQKTKIFNYLDAYIKAIDKYVDNQKYKK